MCVHTSKKKLQQQGKKKNKCIFIHIQNNHIYSLLEMKIILIQTKICMCSKLRKINIKKTGKSDRKGNGSNMFWVCPRVCFHPKAPKGG